MASIKKYMKVGFFIMTVTMAMTGLTGCNVAKDNIKSKIEGNLKQDLGEEFKVFWLQGSHFDTEYEAYVSPVSNPEIRFNVYTDKHGKSKYSDLDKNNYYTAKVWNDFDQAIIKEFNANGIEAFCKAEAGPPLAETETPIPEVTSLDTTVKEYIELIPNCEFVMPVIINESEAMNKDTLNKIVKVLEKANEIYPGISIYAMFYFYDEEWYTKTKDFFINTVHPSSTVLEQNNLKYSFRNGIKDNKVLYTVDEILKTLEESNIAQ